jgi:hypothetical protein
MLTQLRAELQQSIAARAHESTQLQAEIERLKATAAAPAPATGGLTNVSLVLQAVRSAITTHKGRIQTDEDQWKAREVAIGRAISDLLSMVQKNPTNRDQIYAVLGELQGILDAGRRLVKRNRQFLDEEERAIGSMETTLTT